MRAPSLLFGLLAPLLLGSCSKDGDEPADDTAGGGVDLFSEIITITEPGTGSLTCYTPGDDWISEAPDTSCQSEVDISGNVEDFETGDDVSDATIEIYFSDSVSGSGDSEMTTDSSGYASGATAPTCTPVSYKVSTDPALDESKITIEAHQIFDPVADGESIETSFNSVSSDTYAIIPSLLGVSVDPAMGVVAGTAYDCDYEKMEGVQVIAKDENGDYPESQEIRYFVNDFPNRDQPHTSEDGLWIAINLPPGRVTIEMWGVLSGASEAQLIGATELDMIEESINISNIRAGYGDGVFYPSECLAPCN